MKFEFSGLQLAAVGVAAPAAVLLGLNQFSKKYKVAPEDTPPRGAYPGDDLLPYPDDQVMVSNVATEIDAPPEKVWPLINQLGQNKAGFYSFWNFEHLASFRIYNTYEPQERWQDTKVGDWVFYGDQGVGHEIKLHEPGKYIVGCSDTGNPPTQQGAVAWLPHGCKEYGWTWGFFLEPLDGGKRTRMVQRNTVYVEVENKIQMAIVVGLIWGWSSGVMSTRMADVIKAIAEGKKFIDF
ncbi:MAG: hypothetical protein E7000_07085 [Coriobacteriaceae bacterium]|nr:hypothetical protein [Coriobacteriaceae bacterium]